MLEFFLFVAWLWILFAIVSDLFRDHETSGWGKAAWVFVLLIPPFLGALIYLIARGDGIARSKAQADAKDHLDTHIREQAHSSPARAKAKLLA